nr:hypothetical protein Hi04_10k_c5801_00009 [uncultured bacterium]
MKYWKFPESLLLCLLIGLADVPLHATASPTTTNETWSLQSLMNGLSQRRSGEARFTETKYLSSLKKPLMVEGLLHYNYPDSLEKENLKPNLERYVIEGDSLEIYNDAKLVHKVSLSDYPSVEGFMKALIATMSGDLDALGKHFQVALRGTRENWDLKLQPLDDVLKKSIRQIEVSGQASNVTRFEVQQQNGDRSVMQITPLT